MLLNLNNCSVLKPQGYSSLQSISETERYELKNILTFAFSRAEKLVLFFWSSPHYPVCWEGQCFGLVNHKESSSLSGTEISPFSSSTRPKPWLQSTFPPPTHANEGLFLCLPHMCLTWAVFGSWWFFPSAGGESWEQAAEPMSLWCWSWHVLVQLEHSGESSEPCAGTDGTARHEPGAGHHKNVERAI